jgi:nitrous oxidase accessory protein NosD
VKTVVPYDGMILEEDTRLERGIYFLPQGITVARSDLQVDGGGALLVGRDREGVGVQLRGVEGIVLKNFNLAEYYHGIQAVDCRGLTLEANRIRATYELEANTVFLDIWKPAADPYGGAILLVRVRESRIVRNDLQHQQNGLLSYHCCGLEVQGNQAHYSSGFGFHLYDTSDSVFEDNGADYCCRFEPREGGLHFGHVGADAAGFLAVMGSSRNVFRRNTARLSGDGFFLAGLTPDFQKQGCDDNLFEENDASLSPNIAFEATFCRGNVFRKNFADRSNYGFWLGFSWDTVVEENRVVLNRMAGLGVENAHHMRVVGNTFQGNGHGLLLWSTHHPDFARLYPESLTSYDWQIESNTFLHNDKAIRIAALQDHGIRPLAREVLEEVPLPYDHRISSNHIQDNRLGIELFRVRDTLIQENILKANVEADLRESDTVGTVFRNNLGARGGYL